MSQYFYRTFLIVALMAIGGIFTGCTRKPPSKTKEAVMEEKLAERLGRWYTELENNCNKKITERAAAIVDSTLLADARFKRDQSGLPFIPGRPTKPDFVPPKDSVPIKPILQLDTGLAN